VCIDRQVIRNATLRGVRLKPFLLNKTFLKVLEQPTFPPDLLDPSTVIFDLLGSHDHLVAHRLLTMFKVTLVGGGRLQLVGRRRVCRLGLVQSLKIFVRLPQAVRRLVQHILTLRQLGAPGLLDKLLDANNPFEAVGHHD
jgi:hypothetical protein